MIMHFVEYKREISTQSTNSTTILFRMSDETIACSNNFLSYTPESRNGPHGVHQSGEMDGSRTIICSSSSPLPHVSFHLMKYNR